MSKIRPSLLAAALIFSLSGFRWLPSEEASRQIRYKAAVQPLFQGLLGFDPLEEPFTGTLPSDEFITILESIPNRLGQFGIDSEVEELFTPEELGVVFENDRYAAIFTQVFQFHANALYRREQASVKSALTGIAQAVAMLGTGLKNLPQNVRQALEANRELVEANGFPRGQLIFFREMGRVARTHQRMIETGPDYEAAVASQAISVLSILPLGRLPAQITIPGWLRPSQWMSSLGSGSPYTLVPAPALALAVPVDATYDVAQISRALEGVPGNVWLMASSRPPPQEPNSGLGYRVSRRVSKKVNTSDDLVTLATKDLEKAQAHIGERIGRIGNLARQLKNVGDAQTQVNVLNQLRQLSSKEVPLLREALRKIRALKQVTEYKIEIFRMNALETRFNQAVTAAEEALATK